MKIVSKKQYKDISTFPVEIITCELNDGKRINLFCKYSAGMGENNYGHKRGVKYEAKVYAAILEKIPLPTVKYYGHWKLSDKTNSALILAYVGDNFRLLYSTDKNAILIATKWIAKFHALMANKTYKFLFRYERKYYLFWANSFYKIISKRSEDTYGLSNLVFYFKKNINYLLNAPQTVIHGEYYPKNILLKKRNIYPIDWESACIAAGEIDLASLIEGWGKRKINEIKKIYKHEKGILSKLSSQEFEKRLLLAQIYFLFRWVCDNENNDIIPWLQNKKTLNHILLLIKNIENHDKL